MPELIKEDQYGELMDDFPIFIVKTSPSSRIGFVDVQFHAEYPGKRDDSSEMTPPHLSIVKEECLDDVLMSKAETCGAVFILKREAARC